MGLPYHRFVLSSGRLLLRHLQGERVTVRLALDLLFLDERDIDASRPDHVFKSLRAKELPPANATLGELLQKSLGRLSKEYAEFRHTRLFVRMERLASWQRLITRVPPLPLVTHALFDEFARDGAFQDDGELCALLAANLHPSTLPSAFCPILDEMIETEGLNDLHVHLNGTTEADIVWLDALDKPRAAYRDMRSAYETALERSAQPTREQYDQIEEGLSPGAVYQRLRLARQLRFALCEWVFAGNRRELDDLDVAIEARPGRFDDNRFRVRGHPVRAFGIGRSVPDAVCEALFLWRVFDALRGADGPRLAAPLHVYLLLMAQFTRFVVQQTDQKGFDQFQKITINEFRTQSEREYERRFNQMARSGGRDLAFLEGRFAPKDTPAGNWVLIGAILRGYARHHDPGTKPRLALGNANAVRESKRLRLGLVAHFIKEADPPEPSVGGDAPAPRGPWRHYRLRNANHLKAVALLNLHRRSPLVRRYLVGVDAAANELHAPPEVFAPIFRRFRHHGFSHFTYHAGEDFRHLLSGMRAVVEAVEFLDLRRGNRIGHATALGVDPALWWRRIGGRVVMPREDWLDDLVFAYGLLAERRGMPERMMDLRDRIGREARFLYGRRSAPGPDELFQAWKLRRLDPRLALDSDRDAADARSTFDREEWGRIRAAREDRPGAYDLFVERHSPSVRARGRELVEITEDDMPAPLLDAVQRAALERIIKDDIVLEAMLTSNVRIGVYQDYGEHHIQRWLGLRDDLPQPTVVLASDDPGIFGNCLRNDFAHLLDSLTAVDALPRAAAAEHLRRLNRNARIFRFRTTDPTPRP